ncbi:MAG: hypothetical protein P1U32_05220 [Legionellaceae bacterium]|nr:hypothetical protein [Legionellaceae bacterium]
MSAPEDTKKDTKNELNTDVASKKSFSAFIYGFFAWLTQETDETQETDDFNQLDEDGYRENWFHNSKIS